MCAAVSVATVGTAAYFFPKGWPASSESDSRPTKTSKHAIEKANDDAQFAVEVAASVRNQQKRLTIAFFDGPLNDCYWHVQLPEPESEVPLGIHFEGGTYLRSSNTSTGELSRLATFEYLPNRPRVVLDSFSGPITATNGMSRKVHYGKEPPPPKAD